MRFVNAIYLLTWTAANYVLAASPSSGNPKLYPRRLGAYSDIERPSIIRPHVRRRDEGSIVLDRAWVDEVLFSYGEDHALQQTDSHEVENEAGISVTCNTCYIKGIATARVSADDDFDASKEFQEVMSQVSDEITNLTESVKNAVIDFLEDDEEDSFVIDEDFDINLPKLPKCHLQFQFDGMELYMDIDASFSDETTYTLNLYSSESAVGLTVADQEIGVFFTIDLVLSVAGQIDINSGFHIRLNDGLQLDVGLFEPEVSSITMTGGRFEFLPVTLDSGSVTVKAALRLGVQAGLAIDLPGFINGSIGAGAEAGVFANIAEFITTVNVNLDDDDECDLSAVQEYQFALGAAAGASVFVDHFTWGPTPETEIPIWGTTLAQVCVTSGTLTTTPAVSTSAIGRRGLFDDFEGEVSTYTVVGCKTPGLKDCPVSAQTTFTATTTKAASASVQSTAITPIPFGTQAKAMTVTAGKPSSFVPTPTGAANESGTAIGTVIARHTNHDLKLIVGLSVGLGVPFLLAVFAGCFCLYRRKKRVDKHALDMAASNHGATMNTKAI